MQYKQGDKVIVKGLNMAFIVDCYLDENLVRLFIEGESNTSLHVVVHARPGVLLLNSTENCQAEGWI